MIMKIIIDDLKSIRKIVFEGETFEACNSSQQVFGKNQKIDKTPRLGVRGTFSFSKSSEKANMWVKIVCANMCLVDDFKEWGNFGNFERNLVLKTLKMLKFNFQGSLKNYRSEISPNIPFWLHKIPPLAFNYTPTSLISQNPTQIRVNLKHNHQHSNERYARLSLDH